MIRRKEMLSKKLFKGKKYYVYIFWSMKCETLVFCAENSAEADWLLGCLLTDYVPYNFYEFDTLKEALKFERKLKSLPACFYGLERRNK